RVEESKSSSTSGTRSTSSDSTAPLFPDHPLTHTTPALVPSLCRTARMAMHVSPTMSPGLFASIAEVAAMSDSGFHKRFRSSYDSSPSSNFLVRKRYRGTSKLILDIDSEGDELGEEEVEESLDSNSECEDAEDEGPTAGDEGHAVRDEGPGIGVESPSLGGDEAIPGGQHRAALVVKTAVGEPLGLGYEALRCREIASREGQMPSVFKVDPEDGIDYIDVPAYPPPAPPVQTPPSPEWSSGLFPISPIPSIVPSPISSPMISLIVSSPVASPRPEAVRDEIFSQRYRFRSLEHEQERTDVMFGALWRLVLALEAWSRRVDTRMVDMSWAEYDDHRLVHDMLLKQAALQRELQEIRDRVTGLE
nr:hypothetical protein [Tanacetum cinerariifolium]